MRTFRRNVIRIVRDNGKVPVILSQVFSVLGASVVVPWKVVKIVDDTSSKFHCNR